MPHKTSTSTAGHEHFRVEPTDKHVDLINQFAEQKPSENDGGSSLDQPDFSAVMIRRATASHIPIWLWLAESPLVISAFPHLPVLPEKRVFGRQTGLLKSSVGWLFSASATPGS